MGNVARLLVAFGAVAAAVGFTLLGMATAYIYPDPDSVRLAVIIMAAGLAGLVVGLVLNRAAEEPDRSTR